MASDLLALCLLKTPGELGADIVVGSAQRFGVPMGYGGPHAAFFATRDAYKRSTPGRIIGVSVDAHGRPALRMALQTREQHIRRERATSNICTAQVLLANIAGLYAVYHGPDGLRTIAERVHRLTQIMVEGLRRLGFEVVTDAYFDTVTVRTPGQAGRIAARARESRINLRLVDGDHLGISLDETTRRMNLEDLWRVFSSKALDQLDIDALDAELMEPAVPAGLRRTSSYLQHPVFHLYHSETEMLRYLRWLQGEGHRARSVDDPARLVHHEAERHHRDAGGYLPAVQRHPSVRAARSDAGLSAAVRGARGLAVRPDRLRRDLLAAERRLPG